LIAAKGAIIIDFGTGEQIINSEINGKISQGFQQENCIGKSP
jgi:hypothetical protein